MSVGGRIEMISSKLYKNNAINFLTQPFIKPNNTQKSSPSFQSFSNTISIFNIYHTILQQENLLKTTPNTALKCFIIVKKLYISWLTFMIFTLVVKEMKYFIIDHFKNLKKSGRPPDCAVISSMIQHPNLHTYFCLQKLSVLWNEFVRG